MHRILKVLPEGYLIAGNNNAFVVRDVTDEMILGVMVRVIRNGKDIYMDNPWYRLYVHLWCDCWPLRMLILRGIRTVRGVLGAVKRRVFPGKTKTPGPQTESEPGNNTMAGTANPESRSPRFTWWTR